MNKTKIQKNHNKLAPVVTYGESRDYGKDETGFSVFILYTRHISWHLCVTSEQIIFLKID